MYGNILEVCGMIMCVTSRSWRVILLKLYAWLAHSPLKEDFPEIYSMVKDTQALVQCRSNTGWNFCCRRNCNDWELKRVSQLFQALGSFRFQEEEPDKLIWAPLNKSIFTVTSFSFHPWIQGSFMVCGHENRFGGRRLHTRLPAFVGLWLMRHTDATVFAKERFVSLQ